MNNYDPNLMMNIMAWIGGVAAVTGLTAKVKDALCALIKTPQLKALVGYIASGAVSFAVPAVYLWLTDQFAIKLVALMAISMWMTASGIYDQYHTPKQG